MIAFHRKLCAQRALPCLGVVLLCAIALQPSLAGLPKGHDTLLHFYRIPVVSAWWERGVLFSRWAPDLMLGYGYPLFTFYPPLSAYLLTATYWIVGQNAPLAMNATCGLMLVTAIVGMFLLGRELYDDMGALFSAAAYGLSPHLLYQPYQRGSLSNVAAMAFFPWATWAMLCVARAPSMRRIAKAGLAFAGVLLSHTAASLIFVGPLMLLGTLRAWKPTPRGQSPLLHRLGAVVLALASGLGLAAFAWLPALVEFRFTRYSLSISNPDVSFRNFFADVLRWPSPPLVGLANAPIPITVGVEQIALAGLGLLLAALRLGGRSAMREFELDILVFAATIAGLGAAFLASPPSTFIWERSAFVRNLQFPFRWLDISALLFAVTAGYVAHRLGACSWWRTGSVALALVVLFIGALPYVYPSRWRTLPVRPTLTDASQAQMQLGIYGLTSWGEYTPIAVPEFPTAPPFEGADMGATLDTKLDRKRLPSGALIESSGDPTTVHLRLALPEATRLVFDTYYFPGWQARVDGASFPTEADEQGRLTLGVPAGEHNVSVYWGPTPVRRVADGLSIIAALLIGAALLFPRCRCKVETSRDWDKLPSGDVVRIRRALVTLCVLLAVLLAAKAAWFDQCDSPFVRHLRAGRVPGAQVPPWGDFDGELRLLGYRSNGAEHLVLYWQAQRPLETNYAIYVTLVDARGFPVATTIHSHPGRTLTSRWEPSQVIYDDYALDLTQAQRPIIYRVEAAVVRPSNEEKLALRDAPNAAIRSAPVGTIKLAPEHAGRVNPNAGPIFGGMIQLERYTIPSEVVAGNVMSYTLYWRALTSVSTDYQVFVHLLKPDGTQAAGNDGPPRQGLYPSSFWSPHELIVDERAWQVSVPPGEYMLQVGLYDLKTGQRLSISGPNSQLGDRVVLQTLRVTP